MTKLLVWRVGGFPLGAGMVVAMALLLAGCGRPALREPAPPPAPVSESSPPRERAGEQTPASEPPRPVAKAPAPAPPPSLPAVKRPAPAKRTPLRMGFTIQAGAFSRVENAARLTEELQAKGLPATYFVAKRGLYKVRFGNYPTREKARAGAEALRAAGVIAEFYIVRPEQYPLANLDKRGEAYLREEITRTARSYLGIPYLWGGTSPETGFDCSGLTMAVYQLNGLEIPRSSQEQFEMGEPVERASLAKGDLLFFAAEGGEKVSHVGIYAGGDLFIHAPGKGKRIRTDSLAKGHFSRTFLGGRTYLATEKLP